MQKHKNSLEQTGEPQDWNWDFFTWKTDSIVFYWVMHQNKK